MHYSSYGRFARLSNLKGDHCFSFLKDCFCSISSKRHLSRKDLSIILSAFKSPIVLGLCEGHQQTFNMDIYIYIFF